jgi:hypothetical protein
VSPPVVASMRPEPARDDYGRYLLPDPTSGVERGFTRATTVAHTLSDDFKINQWRRRMVAQGLTVRPALLERVEAAAARLAEADGWRAEKPIKDELDQLCDLAASAAGADDGSAWGTALHTLTEWLDAGRIDEVGVPDDLALDLAAYARTMHTEGIERPIEWIERITVNVAIDAAGTFDRILRLPDGRLVIGDLKTQKTVDFGWMEIATQLAEYAYAEYLYDEDERRLVPMVPVDREVGVVMHLPVGSARCTLFEVDLVEGWRCAQLAAEVRRTRARTKAMGRPYTRRQHEAAHGGGDQLMYLITHAQHPAALTALWRDAQARWTPAHTTAAKRRKAELLALH